MMTLELGNKQAIEARRKSEVAYDLALAVRDAINEAHPTLDAAHIGRIMREVGSTIFCDDDISDFIAFRQGIEGKAQS